MRIVIPGGTGQVGTLLARSFVADGHDVTVLTRHPKHAAWRVVQWDARTIGARVAELDDADVAALRIRRPSSLLASALQESKARVRTRREG